MKRLLLAVALILLLAAPWIVSAPFFVHLMIMVLLWTVLGASWNLLGGFAGQVSFGHATFLGSGALIGDFEPAHAKQLLEAYFGDIPPGPTIPPIPGVTELPPLLGEERRETIAQEISLARLYLGYRTPPFGTNWQVRSAHRRYQGTCVLSTAVWYRSRSQ